MVVVHIGETLTITTAFYLYLAEVFSERALLFREIFCIMCYKKRNRPVHVSVDCKNVKVLGLVITETTRGRMR